MASTATEIVATTGTSSSNYFKQLEVSIHHGCAAPAVGIVSRGVSFTCTHAMQELLQTLLNQLADRHLLRLWRTGAMIAVVTAEENEDTDVSPA